MQHSEHVASGGYPSGAVLVPAGTLLPLGRTTPLGTTPRNPPPPAIGYSPCPEPCPYTCTSPTGLHWTAPHRTTPQHQDATPGGTLLAVTRIPDTPHTNPAGPPDGLIEAPPGVRASSPLRWVSPPMGLAVDVTHLWGVAGCSRSDRGCEGVAGNRARLSNRAPLCAVSIEPGEHGPDMGRPPPGPCGPRRPPPPYRPLPMRPP
jgi:hypothetical protein